MGLEDIKVGEILSCQGTKIYWYGKEKRPRRKMGHVNVVGETEEETYRRIRRVLETLYSKEFRAG
jgi:5-(carboxyamino)imidazole ribonucleotide synthase